MGTGEPQTQCVREGNPLDHPTESWLLPAGVSGLWGKGEGTEKESKRTTLSLRNDVPLDIQQEGHGQGQN